MMLDGKQILTEIQHRLTNQYEVSRYIAEKIYDSLGRTNNLNVDISKFVCGIKSINITILEKQLKSTSAVITDIDPIEISVKVYKLWDCLDREWLITDIQNAVSHELMHARILTGTYETYKDCEDMQFISDKINTQPRWYQDINQAMQQLDCGCDEYKFMYAMYTCYYHEKQAFIAQSDTQIKKLLFKTNIERISYKNAASILNRVDSYNTFVQNIEICNKLKRETPLEQAEFLKSINSFLKVENKLTLSEFNNLLKDCLKTSLSAIREIENILVTDFYEINDK